MQAMVFAASPLLPETSARSNRALAAGLAVSLAVHVLVVASVRPISATSAQPGPLRVLIVRESEASEPRDTPQDATAQASTPAAQAEPLNEPPLVYPREAYQARLRGKVTLRMLINERGGVDGVTVLEAEPRGVFEAAALEAAQSLALSPG